MKKLKDQSLIEERHGLLAGVSYIACSPDEFPASVIIAGLLKWLGR